MKHQNGIMQYLYSKSKFLNIVYKTDCTKHMVLRTKTMLRSSKFNKSIFGDYSIVSFYIQDNISFLLNLSVEKK